MLSRARADAVVESRAFQGVVLVLIALNAVAVGLQTSPSTVDRLGAVLPVTEVGIIVAFCCELALRLYAKGRMFLRDPWNWFDLLIIIVALIPAISHLRVLRVARVLRLARLVSLLPSLRRVVAGTIRAMPNIATIVVMLAVALYSGAVVGTQLFGDVPEHFGTLGTSMFTMFEIMTIEAWPDVADAVMARHPAGWVFFVAYLVTVGFVLLNLLIGVIVSAMEFEVNREHWQQDQELEQIQHEEVIDKLARLEARLDQLQRDGVRPGRDATAVD